MELPKGTLGIGPENGSVTLLTHRQGIGSMAGHDLVLVATAWKGTIRIQSSEEPLADLELSVDLTSLEVREGHGGAKPLTAKDREDVKRTLGSKVLHLDRHQTAIFRSTRITDLQQGDSQSARVRLTGDLELEGRTSPVDADVTLATSGHNLQAKGAAKLRQTDWGIKPYQAFLGALKVADEVEVRIDVEVDLEAAAG